MDTTKKDLNMYSGRVSIYSSMFAWARMLYPSDNKFERVSDNVCVLLLNTMSGLPYEPGFHLRVFTKFVAAKMLAEHLQGNKVSKTEAARVAKRESDIYRELTQKALPMPKL